MECKLSIYAKNTHKSSLEYSARISERKKMLDGVYGRVFRFYSILADFFTTSLFKIPISLSEHFLKSPSLYIWDIFAEF